MCYTKATELLTPPPPTPPPESISDLTPRTAAQISALPAPPVKGIKKPRLVMPDHETELTQGLADRAAILGAEHFIPADVELLQLNEIVSDPTSHFLPTLKIGGENWTAVAPLGLAPELTELFAFPSNVLRKGRGLEEAEEDRIAKRPRVEGEVEAAEQIRQAEEEVEVVRRHEFEIGYEPEAFAPAFGGDEGDYGIGEEMPMEPFGVSPPTFRVSRGPSLAPSRAESITREAEYEGLEGEFTLAMFDTRSSRAAESQVSQVPSSPSRAETQREGAPGKYTSMAMDLLRNELQAIEEEDKVVSFEKLAEKVRGIVNNYGGRLVLGTSLIFLFLFNRPLSAPRPPFSLSFFLLVRGTASNLNSPKLSGISRSEVRTSSGLRLPKRRHSWAQRCKFEDEIARFVLFCWSCRLLSGCAKGGLQLACVDRLFTRSILSEMVRSMEVPYIFVLVSTYFFFITLSIAFVIL